MLLGYIRVSTTEQNEARQIKALRQRGVDPANLYIEKVSGKNIERQKLNELLAYVRCGDCVVTESISRIARNTRELLSIIEQLQSKGVEFISLKENLDTTTPQGRFMLTVFGALAELERENILERQREGIEIAKSEGKYKGRKPISIDEEKFKSICARWRAGELTASAAMKDLGLKRNTFYRRVKSLGT